MNFDCVNLLDEGAEGCPVELVASLEEARAYLKSHEWVVSIDQEYLGDFFEGILGIFLFRITPRFVGVDDFVWVLVGDIPSLYITVDECPNPATALDGYIGALEKWVEAVFASQPTDELFPVEAAATNENAINLKSRLEFLDERILPTCRGSLKEDRRQ
ncbi:MAG: hypothetical protein AAGK67_10965 [Pseudomonadota bacterium]